MKKFAVTNWFNYEIIEAESAQMAVNQMMGHDNLTVIPYPEHPDNAPWVVAICCEFDEFYQEQLEMQDNDHARMLYLYMCEDSFHFVAENTFH